MIAKSEQNCQNCYFWSGDPSNFCQRFPPMVSDVYLRQHSAWENWDRQPYTGATKWCGEWKMNDEIYVIFDGKIIYKEELTFGRMAKEIDKYND